MIIFLQFPLTDIRRFLDTDTAKLPVPLWPAPTPYQEFIRSFGPIRVRGKGGVPGWVGENEICNAHRGLVITSIPPYQDPDTQNTVRLSCSARHFFSDGLAVGKLEIVVISHPAQIALSPRGLRGILTHLLKTPVTIPSAGQEAVRTRLIQAGKPLAQLYLQSSSYTRSSQAVKGKAWILPGTPMMVIELGAQEAMQLPSRAQAVPIAESLGVELSHTWLKVASRAVRVWGIQRLSHESAVTQNSRTLRLYLMRFHAEIEALKAVLKGIDSGEIPLSSHSTASDRLQFYLSQVTSRITKLNDKYKSSYGSEEIGKLAQSSLERVTPGDMEGLMQKIKAAQIRPQIYHKFENFINQVIVKEQILGDQYNISGQVGAVGPNAQAHAITFTQVVYTIPESVDMDQLAGELAQLRQAMKREAVDTEQDIAVSEVARAEKAAKAKDRPKVVETLRAAGKWAWDVATKIGVSVAAEVVKRSVGI